MMVIVVGTKDTMMITTIIIEIEALMEAHIMEVVDMGAQIMEALMEGRIMDERIHIMLKETATGTTNKTDMAEAEVEVDMIAIQIHMRIGEYGLKK